MIHSKHWRTRPGKHPRSRRRRTSRPSRLSISRSPPQSEEENTQTEDENKDEQDADQQENTDEEQTAFAPKSTITTAQITITQDDGTEQLTIGQAEEEADQQAEQAKLDQLLQEIQKLQLVSVGQSVALQDANWEASLNLSMEDGTALSCRLYDSTLSGSKTTPLHRLHHL